MEEITLGFTQPWPKKMGRVAKVGNIGMFGSRWLLLGFLLFKPKRRPPKAFLRMDVLWVQEVDGSMVNGSMGLLFHLLINGWWIGVITYQPLILTSFLSGTSFRALAVFLEDGQVQMTFSSYEMEDAIVEDEAWKVEGSDERSNLSGVFSSPAPFWRKNFLLHNNWGCKQLCGLLVFFWGGNRLKKLGNAVLPSAQAMVFSRKFT